MPNINSINSWYEVSKLEFFTPFMKIWLAFNSWYKQFLPSANSDRDAINEVKITGPIKTIFLSVILSDSEEGRELRSSISNLIMEIRVQGLIDKNGNEFRFYNSDIEPGFEKLNKQTKTKKINEGLLIKLTEDNAVTADLSVLFQELMDVIYQIRCDLIHGEFDCKDSRAQRLVKNSYIIMDIIFGPVVEG